MWQQTYEHFELFHSPRSCVKDAVGLSNITCQLLHMCAAAAAAAAAAVHAATVHPHVLWHLYSFVQQARGRRCMIKWQSISLPYSTSLTNAKTVLPVRLRPVYRNTTPCVCAAVMNLTLCKRRIYTQHAHCALFCVSVQIFTAMPVAVVVSLIARMAEQALFAMKQLSN